MRYVIFFVRIGGTGFDRGFSVEQENLAAHWAELYPQDIVMAVER